MDHSTGLGNILALGLGCRERASPSKIRRPGLQQRSAAHIALAKAKRLELLDARRKRDAGKDGVSHQIK